MSITARQTRDVAQGEHNAMCIDWGENTAGEETGCLKDGDTVASCVAMVFDKPDGATDITLGPVTVNSSMVMVNERYCSAGEAVVCAMTTDADQMPGVYRLRFTATTAKGLVLPRFVLIRVQE